MICSSRLSHRFSASWRPSNLPGGDAFSTFFRQAHSQARPRLRDSRFLWLIPLAGGLTIYSYSLPQSYQNPLTSPAVIPYPVPKPARRIQPTILSVAEARQPILPRILSLLRTRIWEPICTGLRYFHLLILFLPVILSTPMLLIGGPEDRFNGEGWGAFWWCDLLVRQMEAAGPTFIKVHNALLVVFCAHLC